MSQYKITCPKCKNNYSLKVPNVEKLKGKSFTCAKCGLKINFDDVFGLTSNEEISKASSSLKTQLWGNTGLAGLDNHTRVARQQNNITIEIIGSNKKYNLSPGSYTLGRDSIDSNANVKLSPDPYMSRLHARLDISASSPSSVVLIPMNPKNNIFINDYRVSPNNPICIKNGDIILLGMTKIKIVF